MLAKTSGVPRTAAAVPPPFRPSDPALCGSCPLVTPYYCRLGDLLCFMSVYRFVSIIVYACVFVLFPLFDLSFVDFPSVLWYCWLGLLTCKNRLPYNLYCVGGDVKHCSLACENVARFLNEQPRLVFVIPWSVIKFICRPYQVRNTFVFFFICAEVVRGCYRMASFTAAWRQLILNLNTPVDIITEFRRRHINKLAYLYTMAYWYCDIIAKCRRNTMSCCCRITNIQRSIYCNIPLQAVSNSVVLAVKGFFFWLNRHCLYAYMYAGTRSVLI